jgi:hypothetical protein
MATRGYCTLYSTGESHHKLALTSSPAFVSHLDFVYLFVAKGEPPNGGSESDELSVGETA